MLTSPGATVGTVAYMSPEQARGEAVDARSDLFSFGTVLYQIATGRLPFDGPTSAVIFHAILEKNPPAPTTLNPLLPPQLDEIILKCLEKDRDLRCQSAAELRADLKRVKRGSSSSGRVPTVTESSSRVPSAPPSANSTSSSPAPAPAAEVLLAEARRHKWRLIAMPAVVAALICAFVLYKRFVPSGPSIHPLNMQITKLTENGAAMSGAISPDGRYVAYIKRGDQQSLWVKQIATGSEAQVVPPGTGWFWSRPTFSPDGNYISYLHSDAQYPNKVSLFSVPSLGGTPQHILDDLSTAVSFSPDGKQIVFAHFDPGRKPELVIAASDGSGRHTIAERDGMAIDGAAPSWSADGRLIAVPRYELGKEGLSSLLIFTPQGELVKTFAFPFLLDGVAWLPDLSGLFLHVRSGEMNFRSQLKFQPYPSGAVENVTNDLNQYHNVGLTADGKALVTVQEQKSSGIYLGTLPSKWPGDIQLNAAPVTPGQAEGSWVEWGSDGKIYFEDEDFHSFRMNPDGSARARVPDRDTHGAYALACGSDAVIFANLKDNNLNLFRQNTATGEIKQLTSERDTEWPSCSSDGKTVYYVDNFEGPALKRVSTDGGPPELVSHNSVNGAALSPDGKRIAFFLFTASGEHKSVIAVQDLDGGNRLTLPALGVVRRPEWAPDGKALILDKATGAGSNLFYQPLDGSQPTEITHFESEPLSIDAYSFSPDGKQIAIGRARVNDSDLVMFSNFR
jgi:Tol biopolymer transport system component